MKNHLLIFTISIVLITSIGIMPIFAELEKSIVVSTDKTSYSKGEVILITGEVRDLYSQYVSLQLIAPNGNLAAIDQLVINMNKTFSAEIAVGGPLMKSMGNYTIIVQYGDEKNKATTSFELEDNSISEEMMKIEAESTIPIEFSSDLIEYEITSGKILSIIPDIDAKSLIIKISTIDEGVITLTIPRSVLDAVLENGEDEDFFVLVDGEEVDFDEISTLTDRTITVEFPAGTEEIEIIGTFVIPEFGTIAAMILAVAIISIIVVSAKSRLSIMPRY
jgi:predicted secreted protein with PEFG-CTERM motif